MANLKRKGVSVLTYWRNAAINIEDHISHPSSVLDVLPHVQI